MGLSDGMEGPILNSVGTVGLSGKGDIWEKGDGRSQAALGSRRGDIKHKGPEGAARLQCLKNKAVWLEWRDGKGRGLGNCYCLNHDKVLHELNF